MLQSMIHPSANAPAIHNALASVEKLMEELVTSGSNSNACKAPAITEAAFYHLESGGSRMRARMALDAGAALGLRLNMSVALAAASELLHNASLIHDDLQDRDQIRRGMPTIWARFGDHVALCVGDLFLSAAYAALGRSEDGASIGALVKLVHSATVAAVHGQCDGFDLASSTSSDLERYIKMVLAKSGSLLSLPLELVLTSANRVATLPLARQAAEEFAIGYQIADDICDITNDRGVGLQPPSANIIQILQALGHGEAAFRNASRLCVQHLKTANDLALRLPAQSGHMLASLSVELSRQLEAGL